MTAASEFLRAGETSNIDPEEDKKLFDLGLVEQYDAKKHGVSNSKDSQDATKLEEANTALTAANTKIAELEEANTALDGFVKAAIKLQKGQAPEGYGKK